MGNFRKVRLQRYQILVIGALLGGAAALWFGFELDWDLLNYHLYNPHALLSGRGALDIAVAQQQTYHNPTLFIPVYLAFKYLSAPLFVFLVGAIQGGQMVLVYLIAEKVIDRQVPRLSLLVVAALGFLGPVFLAQLGATPADTILSALVLGSLLLILSGLEPKHAHRIGRIGLWAGTLLGVAVALKLTMAIYAVGIGIVLIVCYPPAGRLRLVSAYAGGAAIGFLVAGGFWFLHLWSTFGNPFFPYFNSIFDSPWVQTESFRDLRFMPKSMLEWFIYPFLWLADPYRVWESPFMDIRVVMLYPVMFLLPLLRWRWLGRAAPGLRILLVFLALSYVLWITMFSIYRYLAVVEMLASVALFASVVALTERKTWWLLTLLALLGSQFLVNFQRPASSWKLDPNVVTALADLPGDAMVVIDGFEPLGYLTLWLSDDIPVIRIRSNFMNPDRKPTLLYRDVKQRIKAHKGPLYLLNTEPRLQHPYMTRDLGRVGLRFVSSESCTAVFRDKNLKQVLNPVVCRLQRLADISD